MASSDDVYYDTMDSLTDQYATGDLFLTIAQGAYSLTEIEDIDPLEIGTLLGNFGGFWGKFLYMSEESTDRVIMQSKSQRAVIAVQQVATNSNVPCPQQRAAGGVTFISHYSRYPRYDTSSYVFCSNIPVIISLAFRLDT